MSFPTPDPAIIREWGQDVIHTPEGGSAKTVTVVRDHPDALQELPQSTVMVLFGTMADSAFAVAPKKGDAFTVDGIVYRVFDVKVDWAGGSEDTAGRWIYLTL